MAGSKVYNWGVVGGIGVQTVQWGEATGEELGWVDTGGTSEGEGRE